MPNILSFAIKLRYELLIRTGTTAQDAGMTAQNEWNTQSTLLVGLMFNKTKKPDTKKTTRNNPIIFLEMLIDSSETPEKFAYIASGKVEQSWLWRLKL